MIKYNIIKIKEIQLLRTAYENREETVYCCFPLEGQFKEEFTRLFNHAVKYQTVDIHDVLY